MKTKGADAQATGAAPAPPSHITSDAAPEFGSIVADTTLREKYDWMGKPTLFACPAVVITDGTPPRLMILLCAVAMLPLMSHAKFCIRSTLKLACSSTPLLFTCPRF